MSQDNSSNNVIQFPGRKKEAEVKPETALPPATPENAVEHAIQKVKRKASKKTLAGTVLAVILATGAVNRYAFDNHTQSMDFTSFNTEAVSNPNVQRAIASIEKFSYSRDSKWEKQLAEQLASSHVRDIASAHIGRAATMEEKLRWGTLEEKYTITYQAENHRIHSIFLQDEAADPAYILDRAKFLKDYGPLFESDFNSAKLKSVESNNEKTVEAYTLFDKQNRATGEARFELDRHKRLLSLKVEPVQI